jgi:hypothetical protein
MFAGCMLLVVLAMKLFPDLPFAQTLHQALVEAPLRALEKATRRHLIYALVLVVMSFSAGEMVMVLGSADFMLLMAWDVSLYVDALIAGWTLATLLRGRAAWRGLVARLSKPRLARPRAPRRRREATRSAANDSDEDGAGPAYARAA